MFHGHPQLPLSPSPPPLPLFQVTPIRLQQWVRRRARAGGIPRLTALHLVSARTRAGVADLARQLSALAGPRGDVWVVGAQNAGKSSLINALTAERTYLSGGSKGGERERGGRGVPVKKGGRAKGRGSIHQSSGILTEASVPGTTIGLVPLEGVLPGRARVIDTPGLLHPHQLSVRLSREELRMVQPSKPLRPQTFRMQVSEQGREGGREGGRGGGRRVGMTRQWL